MLPRIKILECIRQGQVGGGESHLLSLVENLDRSLFEPVVLSFTDGPMIDRLRQMQVPVHIIHTTKPFDVTRWGAVKNLLKEQRIDLIHAHGTRANSNVLWAAKSLNIPVIYTVHGWSFHPDQNAVVRRIRIMGERYLTSRSDLNISVSASNQQTGKQYMPSFDSIVINNGIDLQKFDPTRTYKDIREEFGIDPDTVLILFIARFTLHKQPLSLIRAFGDAVKTNPNMRLLMVGDGDQKEEAVKMITESGLAGKISLSPFRQDVPDVLAAADIFVLPSLWEGLPIGLLEAMAMGKAVIASNVDGTSEILSHGENGWLVETDQLVPRLSEALVSLSVDENKRKEFGQKAISTVSERFNAANMTRHIERKYIEITSAKEKKGIKKSAKYVG
jgi:glycosyltransferase involved in cell wall biosynthesis